MESLSQNDLINTIGNLTKKVEELKLQNAYLKEIRLQLASLTINSNYANKANSISSSGGKEFGYKMKETVKSHPISKVPFSIFNPKISKLRNNKFNARNNHCNFENENFDELLLENIFEDSFYNSKNQKCHIHQPNFEIEVFTKLKRIKLFGHIFDNLIHCSCYLYISELFYVASYLCESIEHSIMCVHNNYSPFLMEFLVSFNNIIKTIPSISVDQCQIFDDMEYDPHKKFNQFVYEAVTKYIKWRAKEQLEKTNSIFYSVTVSELSYSYYFNTVNFHDNIIKSYLGYSSSLIHERDLKIRKYSYLLRKSLKAHCNKLNFHSVSELSDKTTYSVTKSSESKPPRKLVIKSVSNITKKDSTKKLKLCQKKYNSFVGAKIEGRDFSKNGIPSNSLANHVPKIVLLTQSRKVWHEKFRISFSILLTSTVAEIIYFTGQRISMLPINALEFNYENIRNLGQEFVEKRMNRIIESQLNMPSKDIMESKINPIPSMIEDDFIKLKTLNRFESTFSKYDFQDRYFENDQSIYDMKNLIKSNAILKNNKYPMKTITNSPGLSAFHIEELMKMNGDKSNEDCYCSKKKLKLSDSTTDSSLTIVQNLKNDNSKYPDSIIDLPSEYKSLPRDDDSVLFSDFEQDISMRNTHSGPSFDGESRKCISMDSVKKTVTKTKINRTDCPYPLYEKSKELMYNSQKSRMSQRKPSFTSFNENHKNLVQFHKEYQDSRNKIKLSLLKHLIHLGKGDDNFKINTLRNRAASYILNSKLSFYKWQKESNSETSEHMKNFLNNTVNRKVANLHKCEKCCTSFKLGSELRQHLRSHKFRTKSVAT